MLPGLGETQGRDVKLGKNAVVHGSNSGDCIKGMSIAFLSTYKDYSSAFSLVKNLEMASPRGGGLQTF